MLDAVHPVAVQLGPITIHWYGVMVALGFLVGLWNASRRAPRAGLPAEKILDLGPWLILGGIVGGRALYVITFWQEQFAGQPFWEVFAVHHGGLVFYGGLIGATLAGVWAARRKRLPLGKLTDLLAPSVALGYAIGRIGCLLNGCCYGHATALPWAIRFPPGHETHPVGKEALPVHPTQLYESLSNLALYLALAWFWPRRRFDGQVFAVYLLGYATLRAGVELFRGDYPASQRVGGFTPAQVVSVLIFLVGVAWWFTWKPRGRNRAN